MSEKAMYYQMLHGFLFGPDIWIEIDVKSVCPDGTYAFRSFYPEKLYGFSEIGTGRADTDQIAVYFLLISFFHCAFLP